MMKQFSLLFSFFIFLSINTKSQEVFRGKLTNAKNSPITNASISVLNANTNAITDSEGNFKLKLPTAGRYQLEISHINFASIHPIIKV